MKRALVLCGGGSLGSYEIGAWKYLREKGMHFDIVVGTSIGAINGAMVALDEYEEALRLWEEVTIDNVISEGFNVHDTLMANVKSLTREKIVRLAGAYIKNKGADITPFKELVKRTIDPSKIKQSPVKLGIVTTDYQKRKEVDILLNDEPADLILPWLHASSACWPIFPIEKVKGRKYIDGGYFNNLPIDYALRLGADEIVAVLLHSIPKMPQHPELMDCSFVKTIRPSRDTGTILFFESRVLKNNITLGYLDAMKAFDDAIGFSYCFEKNGKYQKIAGKTSLDFARKNTYDMVSVKNAMFTKDMPKPSESVSFYIRGLELLGAAFEITPYKKWDVDEFAFEIEKEIKKSIDEGQATGAKKGRKKKRTRKELVLSLYSDMQNGKKTDWIRKCFMDAPESLYLEVLIRNLFF